MNPDFMYEIIEECDSDTFKICNKCQIYKNCSCSEKNCEYSPTKIVRHVQCINALETTNHWNSLQKEIKHIIMSLVLPPGKDSQTCEFCHKSFCYKHNKTFLRYTLNEYITTCPECYEKK